MKRLVAPVLLGLLLLVAPEAANAAAMDDPFSSAAADELMDAAAAPSLPSGFTDTAVWTGLVTPTTLRWAPDGRVFVALKSGVVDVFDSTSDPTPTVYADLRPKVDDFLDRGLLGLAIDPQFTSGRPYIYVLYTYDKDPNSSQFPRWNDDCPDPPGADGDGCVVTGRLSRIDPDGTEHVLIEDWCNQFSTHTIGALNFGPDGALYASSGDGASYTFADYGQGGSPRNPCGDPPGGVGGAMSPPTAAGGALRSQSFRRAAGQPVTLDGSIIRVDPDTGAARADNPAAGDANANRRRIVAYGMRNPFRFTFRPGTSEIWFGDVGWNTWEEVNRDPRRGVGAQLRLALLRGLRADVLVRHPQPQLVREPLLRGDRDGAALDVRARVRSAGRRGLPVGHVVDHRHGVLHRHAVPRAVPGRAVHRPTTPAAA